MSLPSAAPPVAVVIERNRLVGRRVARVLGVAGWDARPVETPEAAAPLADGARLLYADAFDAPALARLLGAHPHAEARGLLASAEPCDRLAPLLHAEPRIDALLGRADFDSPPRESELLAIARALRTREPIPDGAHLAWGAAAIARRVATTEQLEASVAEVVAFVGTLGAPKRVAEMQGELAHELLMNALYDAPVDASGRPRHAHDRKARVALPDAEAAQLRCACDGVRLALEVTDPFGRLERAHVTAGLERGLAGGQEDRSGGGAGLGFVVAWRSVTALHVDVTPRRRTRVVGLFDLDLNLREFRTRPKSLSFLVEGSA